MKVAINNILYTFLILLVVSCNKITNKNQKNLQLILKDSLIVDVPVGVYLADFHWMFNNKNNSQKYWVNSDAPIQKLSIYNLISKSWNVLEFEEDGPSGIGNATGFYYSSPDSVFVFSGYEKKIQLFDGNLKQLNSYPIRDDYTVNLHTYRKALFKSDIFYIAGGDYVNYNKPDGLNSAYALLKYDLNSGKQTKIINYPSEFHNKIWKREYITPKFLINDSNIIVSFGSSKYLYIYDLEGNFLFKKKCESNYLKEAQPLAGSLTNNSDKALYNYFSDGFYSYILFDSKKNVYYRLAHHLPKKVDPKSKYLINQLQLSIMVLDENLDLKDEYILPESVSGYHAFVDNGLLYLGLKPQFENNCNDECRTFYLY